MAALLRSVHLLKISPSPLLQLKGTYRHAATASAVYSRATCRSVAGPSRALSSLSPYSSGSACSTLRYYGMASEQEGEVSAELVLQNKQADDFNWALSKLNDSVRKSGRITKTLLQKIFQDIYRKKYPSGNQALLLLRSCGSLLPELPFEKRTEFAHQVWDQLQKLGVTYDVSHYNALLKVYLQNEFKFSPTNFLAKMEAANVEPNRVTYQRLLAAYCEEGDLEGTSEMLAFMKSKDMPITEGVFNSLVTGHSRAGDLESAVNILSVMRGAGIEPGPETYASLLCAYAENGDIAKMKETIDTLPNTGISLKSKELMQVVFSLAKAGHQQHIDEIVPLLKSERFCIPEIINVSLCLITLGMEDAAFAVLKLIPLFGDPSNLGNFFLRHCVTMNMSVEKLAFFCNNLRNDNYHKTPLQFTLRRALETQNMAMAIGLMKIMKEEGLPIRPHYFWPLLNQHQKDKNPAGTVEVLKAMQELNVVPDVYTYSMYVLNSFSSVDHVQASLKDAGYIVDNPAFVSELVRYAALRGHLSTVFSLMSDPSLPAMELYNFRKHLLAEFKRSQDVESMAKITELIYKDSRYKQKNATNAETVGYMLYSLFKAMEEEQIPEEKLRKYLIELKERDIIITENIYRGIKKILYHNNMPALLTHVVALTNLNEETEKSYMPFQNGLKDIDSRDLEMSKGSPLDSPSKQLYRALSAEQDLSSALELKTKHEDTMTVGCYVLLLKLCCKLDNVEEAMKLKKELDLKNLKDPMGESIYLSLVFMLSKHNRLDEAIDLLKEMKEKNVTLKRTALLLQTLKKFSLKGESDTVRRLQDTVFSLGLVNPSSTFCSPLITSYLERGDWSGALEAIMECYTLYKQLPRFHDLACVLIEKGETELLQKAMDYVNKTHGEMAMLYELLFAFLWTGHYKEARTIIETPGLRAKPPKLQWFAERCIRAQKMETLEILVDMTAKLFECDRDEMYYYVLRLCKATDNWQQAEAMWMKMQEENVVPREQTLLLLAEILKRNNQNVPFKVPEVWYEQPEAKEKKSFSKDSTNAFQQQVMKLCKSGNSKDAFEILKKADSENMPLKASTCDILIRALLAEGNMEDSMAVKDIAVRHFPEFTLSDQANSLLIVTQVKMEKLEDALACLKAMIKAKQVPLSLAIKQLVRGLGSQGDVKGIQEVQNMISKSMNIPSELFTKNIILAHVKNGDLNSTMELLELMYTQDKAEKNFTVFQDLIHVINENALDQLSAMVERLCHQFALYYPVTDLFIAYLEQDKTEKAKFLLQRCAAIAEQRDVLVRFMTKISNVPGKAPLLKNLLELVPDFIDENTSYSYLLKSYVNDKDLSSAKALYQQMLDRGLEVNELSLKRLASLYRDAGEEVPFEEPPNSFKYYAEILKASKTQSPAEN